MEKLLEKIGDVFALVIFGFILGMIFFGWVTQSTFEQDINKIEYEYKTCEERNLPHVYCYDKYLK